MVYVGSKNRISKDLVPVIQKYINESGYNYFEPFVGGANVIDKIKANKKIGSDNNPYLIALLKQAQKDVSIFPESISKEKYKEVLNDYKSNNLKKYENWEIGLYGFCGSYGSKFFDTFAKANNRDIPKERINNIKKQSLNLKNIDFVCGSYKKVPMNIKKFVIYCDIPYKGTYNYKGEIFDYDYFYEWVKIMSKNNIVLISEYEMPSDRFECIWEKNIISNLSDAKMRKDKKEKLFIYKGEKQL